MAVKPITSDPNQELKDKIKTLKNRVAEKTQQVGFSGKLSKIVSKFDASTKQANTGAPMNVFEQILTNLQKLEKQAFVPADQVGEMPPVDPATGMPMDPAMMGMPPGAPMDPAMMGMPPGAPMDPSMMGMPPGAPMDPAMMGMPPGVDPAMMGAPPAPAAPPVDSNDPSRPATMADIAMIEERLKSWEGLMKDMVDTIDKLSSGMSASKQEAGSDPAQGESASPVMPGPFGGNQAVLNHIVPTIDNGKPEALIKTLNKLRDVTAGA